VYRPEGNPTLLVPSNGLISVVGAKSVDDIEGCIRNFRSELNGLGINLDERIGNINVRNIVVKGDFNSEFDLNALAVGIGLERCEYEPEQFPGLIFRTERESTVLVFRTGAFLIMGTKSYDDALQEFFELSDELESLGIKLRPE
jgi:transcription initiation factor TFIID TATA-box-binding protein